MVEIEPTTLIAIIGVGLSASLLIWGVIKYYLENNPRLKVDVSIGNLVYVLDISPTGILITVANIGKRPVTISSVGFSLKDGRNYFFADDSDHLPKRLEEGENHILHRTFEDLKLLPLEYAWVKDQTGKEYKSENLKKYPTIKHFLEEE